MMKKNEARALAQELQDFQKENNYMLNNALTTFQESKNTLRSLCDFLQNTPTSFRQEPREDDSANIPSI